MSVRVYMLSHVQLFATPWTVACQTPLSMRIPRQEYEWIAISFFRGSSQSKDQTHVSCVLAGRFFPTEPPGKPNKNTFKETHPFIYTHIRPQNAGNNSLMWFTLFWRHSGKLRFTVIGLIGYFYLCNNWGRLHDRNLRFELKF